jgi:hypothetical protein
MSRQLSLILSLSKDELWGQPTLYPTAPEARRPSICSRV